MSFLDPFLKADLEEPWLEIYLSLHEMVDHLKVKHSICAMLNCGIRLKSGNEMYKHKRFRHFGVTQGIVVNEAEI